MIYRGLFLADGSSDTGLSGNVERLCAAQGFVVRNTVPDLDRFPRPLGKTVKDRLQTILELDDAFDIIFIHRDAEGQDPARRRREISTAIDRVGCDLPAAPIIPVRMTEAWLLLDEKAIREVAGRPSGTNDLRLPAINQVERLPNPKRVLAETLIAASQLRGGRKLKRFRARFNEQRRQLLDRLDHEGPITRLTAWQELVNAIDTALALCAARSGTAGTNIRHSIQSQ